LKSGSANSGVTHLSALCMQLETSGKENEVVNPIQTTRNIEVEFNTVVVELEQIVSN
jgi:HPt (histidine-containing phosphotransfer) domain-containing protein